MVRVDDRLVHGQVVVGWGRAMRLRRIVLVDDAISESDWEQELYRMGVPDGMEIEFTSVAGAAAGFVGWDAEGDRTMVLVGDVATLERLSAVAAVTRVTLGGIHAAAGRRERLPYVFLSDAEATLLEGLAGRGVAITAQAVPTTAPVPLAEVLR
ncbi:MAG TPA: PTS sugar transporter subunit IIB [Gemmatimonadales bacterium]|jgi:PTS system mannose-specific IIB component/fructoselysine and glucoselysine-specific PTS system IIB component